INSIHPVDLKFHCRATHCWYGSLSARKNLPNSTFFSLPDNGVGGVRSETPRITHVSPGNGLPDLDVLQLNGCL
ncbi:MAG TPA: hypothetical protein VL866_10675, partial [Pyrinomonadaceae bacterium]|nr:hypothetical protein [Pyrinomonadaceae bacterium]